MNAAALRARLLAAPHAAADGDPALIRAAVLVPILLGPPESVLLTKRHAGLQAHAGQVSFPGGRIDPDDASPEAAALREAWEEVGLDPARVELLGRLPEHVTGSGYLVTPVVGLVHDAGRLRPSPHEVEKLFQLELQVLTDPAAPRRARMKLDGAWHDVWTWPHPEHHIWGATAAILAELARVLAST